MDGQLGAPGRLGDQAVALGEGQRQRLLGVQVLARPDRGARRPRRAGRRAGRPPRRRRRAVPGAVRSAPGPRAGAPRPSRRSPGRGAGAWARRRRRRRPRRPGSSSSGPQQARPPVPEPDQAEPDRGGSAAPSPTRPCESARPAAAEQPRKRRRFKRIGGIGQNSSTGDRSAARPTLRKYSGAEDVRTAAANPREDTISGGERKTKSTCELPPPPTLPRCIIVGVERDGVEIEEHAMTIAEIEQRLTALEKSVEELKEQVINDHTRATPTPDESADRPEAQPWWVKGSGRFANDPIFDEIVRLGREYRLSLREDLEEGDDDHP